MIVANSRNHQVCQNGGVTVSVRLAMVGDQLPSLSQSLHLEGIRARVKVRIGGRPLGADIVPGVIEPVQPVGIVLFLRHRIVQRSELEGDHRAAIRYRDPPSSS